MLSLLDPTITQHFAALPGGVLPFRNGATGKLFLCIKASREAILATKLNNGFKFYVAPLPSPWGLIPVLLTAFFDDDDEPLLLTTPMFDDELPVHVREMLGYDELEIYFLDEHNREWASYRAHLADGGSCLIDGSALIVRPFSEGLMMQIFQHAKTWFGHRGPEDDAQAITVSFVEALTPEFTITDMDRERNSYVGGAGFTFTQLVRDNPGPAQERDIVACLKRVFPGEQIVLSPKRRDTKTEFVDVMVTAERHLLLIQAKDSPNTETSLRRSISRKRQTALHQLKKAVKQAKGAASHARSRQPVDLTVGLEPFPIMVGERRLFSIVVIKELFEHDGAPYVEAFRELDKVGGGVVLDYPGLDQFTFRLSDPEDFIDGLEAYAAMTLDEGRHLETHAFLLAFTAGERAGWPT